MKLNGRPATIICAALFASGSIYGRTLSTQDHVQSWNDLQITVSLSKRFELNTVVSGRFGSNIKKLSDVRFAVGVGWKPNKNLTITPAYWLIRGRNATGQFHTEHRYNLRATYKLPVKRIGIIHRSKL